LFASLAHKSTPAWIWLVILISSSSIVIFNWSILFEFSSQGEKKSISVTRPNSN
jgi:hypothetical protein